jgi:hypothetical protein
MRFEFTKWPSDKTLRTGTEVRELESLLALITAGEQFQLWLFRDEESACVLANHDFAYLCILGPGTCILCLDPGFCGPEDCMVEIYLENGQLDEMPRAHCINREVGVKAGLHYFRTGARAPFVSWSP